MNVDEYQDKTQETAMYREGIYSFLLRDLDAVPKDSLVYRFLRLAYCVGKLNGEAGEVGEEVFKALRDDGGIFTEERLRRIRKELGDDLWYVSQICNELDFSMSEIMQENIDKLQERKQKNTLHGSGSDR